MDMAQIEHVLEILSTILSCLARPLFWTETPLFSMLGLSTSSSFRMFPRADTVPDYPAHIAHSCALITILFIPHFISRERSPSRAARGALGRELYPLTKGASLLTQYLVMFARVWLAVAWINLTVAWINLTVAQFMTGGNRWLSSAKLGCVSFIL